ncbi:MAG: hypothetical protein H6704_19700 [Myxococcales bacterium]|nr:hypothetical protein [Myxococcales bacterium]MCB9538482.1 hypothetical protein [Myxococcales bacterium]
MPFDWMHVPHASAADALRDQTERALRERARLLHRLGYDATYAADRCRRDLAWEFDLTAPAPLDDDAIDALIEGVYGEKPARAGAKKPAKRRRAKKGG